MKLHLFGEIVTFLQSLPVRERGLKPALCRPKAASPASLPVRERGLKQHSKANFARFAVVAPRAGAWIEALLALGLLASLCQSLPVRERGLKLNTVRHLLGTGKSLPVRERGLKLAYLLRVCGYMEVAPRAGAWIEATLGVVSTSAWTTSLPVRERGLKLQELGRVGVNGRSLPVRERGLKPGPL